MSVVWVTAHLFYFSLRVKDDGFMLLWWWLVVMTVSWKMSLLIFTLVLSCAALCRTLICRVVPTDNLFILILLIMLYLYSLSMDWTRHWFSFWSHLWMKLSYWLLWSLNHVSVLFYDVKCTDFILLYQYLIM